MPFTINIKTGCSEPSESFVFTVGMTTPSKLAAPIIVKKDMTSMELRWEAVESHDSQVTYKLEMEQPDEVTSHV